MQNFETNDTTLALGRLLGMLVHDLRNPGATIGANVSFVREMAASHLDTDAHEALQDVDRALADMMMGLEHVGWIGRWLSGEVPIGTEDGFVHEAAGKLRPPPEGLRMALDMGDESLRVRGGGRALQKVMQLFVENAAQHARRGLLTVRCRREGDSAWIDFLDEGMPLAEGLRELAFTLDGQMELKGRAEGRYGRVASLLAAKILCDAIGARIESGEEDGKARFRIVAAIVN